MKNIEYKILKGLEMWQPFLDNKCRYILDIGCDEAQFHEFIPEGLKVVGVDFSKKAVTIAKLKGHNIQVGNILNLDFPDNTFDGVNCSHILEHIEDVKLFDALKELRRVLKPNGLLIIRVPDFTRLGSVRFYGDPTHITPFTHERLKRLILMTGGFKDITIGPGRGTFKLGCIVPLPSLRQKLDNTFAKLRSAEIVATARKE